MQAESKHEVTLTLPNTDHSHIFPTFPYIPPHLPPLCAHMWDPLRLSVLGG